jgi:hypothetical protein
MQLVCEWCGKAFQAKRSDAKTCCSDHRGKLAARKKGQATLGVIDGGGEPDSVIEDDYRKSHPSNGDHYRVSRLVQSIEAALEKAEKLETPQGQALLHVADRLARNYGDNASGVAALSKELTRLLDLTLAGTDIKPDALNELEERRRMKAAQA